MKHLTELIAIVGFIMALLALLLSLAPILPYAQNAEIGRYQLPAQAKGTGVMLDTATGTSYHYRGELSPPDASGVQRYWVSFWEPQCFGPDPQSGTCRKNWTPQKR